MGDVIDAYFEAINAESWGDLATLFAEDAVVTATGARLRQGRDAVLAYYSHVLANYRTHLDTPTRRIDARPTVVVEISFVGVTLSGRCVAFDAVDVFDLGDGLIKRLSTWYDTGAVARML